MPDKTKHFKAGFSLADFNAGDPAALAGAYEQHFEEIHAFAKNFTRLNGKEPWDIAQESFIQLALSRDRDKPVENIRAFLYATAQNGALDEYRKERRRDKHMPGVVAHYRDAQNGILRPDRHAELRDAAALAREKLRELPPAVRWAMLLQAEDNLSVEEIAKEMNVERKSVSGALSKGRAQMKKTAGSLLAQP